MFSNKLYSIKIVIALFAVVWLFYYSSKVFPEIHPRFFFCQPLPEQNDGRFVVTNVDKVIAVNPQERSFDIMEEGFTIKVKDAKDLPEKGDFVSMTAIFHKENFLTPETMIIHKNYMFKRISMYVISLTVMLVWLFCFLKVFKPVLHKGVFLSKEV